MNVLYNIIDNNKIPYDSDTFVGIEIECIINKNNMDYDIILNSVKDEILKLKLEHIITVTTDGSIKDDKTKIELIHGRKYNHLTGQWEFGYYNETVPMGIGIEFKVLTKNKDLFKNLRLINKLFKKLRPRINSTCGLHIHLDARYYNVKDIVLNLLDKQKEIHSKVDIKRIKNKYCKPTTVTAALRSLKGSNRYSRYKDINTMSYKKYGTIEVRIHEGTIDTAKIYGWVKYLNSIAYKKRKEIAA